jgi:hypothetical protein
MIGAIYENRIIGSQTDDPDIIRRRPIFPGRYQPSIVSTRTLNGCVRDGNRCFRSVIFAGKDEGDVAPSRLHKGRDEEGERRAGGKSGKDHLKVRYRTWI